eukprot:gnl/Chilomastix_caulleri/3889.p2 GENE.gnl/Chilomastix_caulleri/3889~~gnl/Chilomastix_caulleri/3889.p2  ORF type:complete len:52 (+),score=4.71 gnl/Chilomastix_caulleri/3889:84-239(+)
MMGYWVIYVIRLLFENCEDEFGSREEFSYTLTVESICFLCYYFIKFGCLSF